MEVETDENVQVPVAAASHTDDQVSDSLSTHSCFLYSEVSKHLIYTLALGAGNLATRSARTQSNGATSPCGSPGA